MWSYVDLAGTRTDVTSTTDASTGVSIIQVYTTQPGSYSCEVTENGGSSRTYTAVMTESNHVSGNYCISLNRSRALFNSRHNLSEIFCQFLRTYIFWRI